MSSDVRRHVSVKRALFRADAAGAIGGGHIARCLALADALSAEGWDCRFSTLPESTRIVPALSRYRCLPPVETLSAWDERYDVTVVDHYGLNASWEAHSRRWSGCVVALDDAPTRHHDCDILLDPNPGRSASAYDGLVPQQCRRILGADYALLPEAYSRLRQMAWERQQQARKSEALRILINFGMTAEGELYGLALEAIAQIVAAGYQVNADLVLGASADNLLNALRERAERAALPVRIWGIVSDLAELMARADIAIGAAGVSSWERCCLALPAIILVCTDNQKPNAMALDHAGAAMIIGSASDVTRADLFNAFSRLSDPDTRQKMARNAAVLCDGLGARRVVTLIDPLRGKDGASVRLRPAEITDADVMLQWQRQPGARRFARNPSPPDSSTHARWLRNKLSDPMCSLMLIEHAGNPVGVLRLDAEMDGSMEVSILVDAAHGGHGIGRAALSTAARIFKGRTLSAEVLPENERSHALFRRCGYIRHGNRYLLNA